MLMPGTLTINSSPDCSYVNSVDPCSIVPSLHASISLSPVNTFFVILSLLNYNIIGLAGQHTARSNARTHRYFVFLVPTLLPAGEALLPRLLIRYIFRLILRRQLLRQRIRRILRYSFRYNLDSSFLRLPLVIHALNLREQSVNIRLLVRQSFRDKFARFRIARPRSVYRHIG